MVKKKTLKKQKDFLKENQNQPKSSGLIEYEPLDYISDEKNFMDAAAECLEKDDFESLVEIIESYLWALQIKASMKDGTFPKVIPEEPKINRALLRDTIEKAKRSSVSAVTLIKELCIEAPIPLT